MVVLLATHILLIILLLIAHRYRTKSNIENFMQHRGSSSLDTIFKTVHENSMKIGDLHRTQQVINNNISNIIELTSSNIDKLNQSRLDSFHDNGYVLFELSNKRGLKEHILSYLKNSDKKDEDSFDNDITNMNVKIVRFILLADIDETGVCDVNPLKLNKDKYKEYGNLSAIEKSKIIFNNSLVNSFGILLDKKSDYYVNDVLPNVVEKIKRMGEDDIRNKIRIFAKQFLKKKEIEGGKKTTELSDEKKLAKQWWKRFPCDLIYNENQLLQTIKLHIGSFIDIVQENLEDDVDP